MMVEVKRSGYSYLIAEYQITRMRYFSTVDDYSFHVLEEPDNPIEKISWWDAIKFCNKKSKAENLAVAYDERTGVMVDVDGNPTADITKVGGYRLPTEDEWFYVAGGGKGTIGYVYPGNNSLDEIGWYKENSGGRSHPVGEKQPNEFGIYDMLGNVWEWTNTSENPTKKILVGGSYDTRAELQKSYCRRHRRKFGIGLRISRTILER